MRPHLSKAFICISSLMRFTSFSRHAKLVMKTFRLCYVKPKWWFFYQPAEACIINKLKCPLIGRATTVKDWVSTSATASADARHCKFVAFQLASFVLFWYRSHYAQHVGYFSTGTKRILFDAPYKLASVESRKRFVITSFERKCQLNLKIKEFGHLKNIYKNYFFTFSFVLHGYQRICLVKTNL